MKNKRTAISCYLLIVSVVCLGLFQAAFGTINFHNRSSTFAMQRGRSLLLVKNNSKVIGWNLESIVRDFGNNKSWQWVESYTNNVVVSVAAGKARSNLLYATSDAVVRTAARVTWNSNTLLRLTKNNSDTLLKLNRYSSNTLLRLTTNNSNAILVLDRKERTDSNALIYLTKNNSNTLLRLTRNNSNTILAGAGGNTLAQYTSNALLFLNRTFSNSILLLDRKERTDSNALIYLTKNNSNTLLRLIKNISDSVINIDADPNLIIAGPTFTMQRSYEVTTDGTVSVTGNTTLNGNGHSFNFGKSSTSFSISASKFLILTNVVLKNFENGSIALGGGSSVTFGEGTRIEFADAQSLTANMTFSGAAIVQGFGNKMTMNNAVISVLPGGRLTLQDIFVDGLKQNNIRAMGNTASVKFKNSILSLASDYSFTTGRIEFEMDVQLVGTNTFGYRPTNAGSKILARSKLALDTGVTLSYAPVAANRDLLGMVDRSSILSLNGCTLKSTTTGMRLINGLLVIDHKNQVYNDGATSVSQAIAFGNGTAANDLGIEILPGGRLLVNSGQLAYQNAS